MSSLNSCSFIGSVGKDPEIRAMQNGKEIASFSIACGERWKDKQSGDMKEKTVWVPISVFNENLVKVVKSYVKKGSKLFVEGSFETHKWNDKDGVERYTTEIVLSGFKGKIVLLDSKNSDQTPHDKAKTNAYMPEDDFDDEVPF